MSYYWGMDTMVYPGKKIMLDWKQNSDLKFTGYYLAPGPHRKDASWMGVNARQELAAMGWGFVPIYLGQQLQDTSKHTQAQAEKDAQQAVDEAQAEGFPSETYIYFDVEAGDEYTADYISYLTSWCRYLKTHSSYKPGIYCSYKRAGQIKNMISEMGGRVYCWRLSYKGNSGIDPAPCPADCTVDYASIWQLEQNVFKTFGSHTLKVDMNSSLYQDPSK